MNVSVKTAITIDRDYKFSKNTIITWVQNDYEEQGLWLWMSMILHEYL